MMTSLVLEERSRETEVEAINMLKRKGRCAIIRPTGFGKTVIMCRIAQRYNRVLYIYPSEIVKEAAVRHLKGKEVTFWSYNFIGKFHKNIQLLYENVLDKYDLIIFDEIHHMGANNVKYAVSEMLKVLDTDRTHIIGGTATPKRMDGYDVIDSFFDNCVTSFYGLNNTIEDGLIPEPYYVHALQGYQVILRDLEKAYKNKLRHNMLSEIKRKEMELDLRTKENQLAYTMNAPAIIKEAIDTVYSGVTPQYMRFMVFCSTKAVLDKKSEEATEWFRTLYSDYDINTLTIYSKAIEKKNVQKLIDMKNEPNKIDLIFSINMLNEGYHIDDITGCILLRPTKSQTVYKQQVGRSMQVGMDYKPIIIDLVENLKTEALFDVDMTSLKQSTTDSEISRQLNDINYIKPKNIHIIDKVADIRELIERLSSETCKSTEEAVIDLRLNSHMPAGMIARRLKLNPWEVFQILDKNRERLKECNHELQEKDVYMKGHKLNEKESPDFRRYLQMLTGA